MIGADKSTWQESFTDRKSIWESRLRVAPGSKEYGYGHFRHDVEILTGEPPTQALLDCANGWSFAYHMGVVEYRFVREDDGGQKHRYARVKVYTD